MSKILHIWVVVSAMTTGEEDIAMLTVFYLTNRRPRTNAAPKKGIRLLLDEYKEKLATTW